MNSFRFLFCCFIPINHLILFTFILEVPFFHECLQYTVKLVKCTNRTVPIRLEGNVGDFFGWCD